MENCLTYAFRVWRYSKPDSHLIVRRSHWGWYPHFAVMIELADGTMVKKEYKPIEPRPRFLPPLFFKGKEVTTYYRRTEQGEVNDVPTIDSGAECTT